MEIPPYLLEQISRGRAVLFLGAGALAGSTNSKGQAPPMGKQLAEMLSDRFLGGEHKTAPLQVVAELAISESDLFTVQEYIRETFKEFEPASFHLLICTFGWKGLATTNYDLVIERAYQRFGKGVQHLVPFIKDGDRVEEKLRKPGGLMLLKLHGCITNTADASVPLILTIDQYITHREGRRRLFMMLREWAYEHPVVFVGHSLQDPDVRLMLQELGELETRPMCFTVTPQLSGAECRFWQSRRIFPLEVSFEDFLKTLDSSLTGPLRGLAAAAPEPELPIAERFVVAEPGISIATQEFLQNDVEYVRIGMPIETIEPQLFYRGYHGSWSPIEQNLDVRRSLGDTIVTDAVLGDEDVETMSSKLHVIKGHAGSGKSVLLRRVAWEAATEFRKLCLFLQPHGRLSFDALLELHQLTKEPIFVFVDNAGEHVSEILEFLRRGSRTRVPVTILAAERNNEWNMCCEELNPLVHDEFEVGYLTKQEIQSLLDLLEHHRALGTLQKATPEERMEAFEHKAGRQLLVALHEATLGKRFEDIIEDEYSEILPDLARSMYLGICVLNRLDVPVRAGIIARVYGVSFTDFRDNFFKPLEKVVFTTLDQRTRDYAYTARHPHIAEIVFQRALSSPTKRRDAYIPLLRALNIDYASDRGAYRRLARARSLLDLFPDIGMIEAIYEVCRQNAGDDPYLFHQMAIYEMNRTDGNLKKATSYLIRAHKLMPSDRTVTHSLAELELTKAQAKGTGIEFQNHLREAQRLARQLVGPQAPDSYGHHTLAKIGLAKLREILGRPPEGWNDTEAYNAMQDVEEAVESGLQRFPDASHLLSAESDLSTLLTDDDRAEAALKRAFETNPSSTYSTIRLAKHLVGKGDSAGASDVYKQALDANPNEMKLHYNYARLLKDIGEGSNEELEYHFQRAFTPGDRSYDAQFWYARQLYVNGKIAESLALFQVLEGSPVDPAVKRDIRGPMMDSSGYRPFTGRISRIESDYSFIIRDGAGDRVFLHVSRMDDSLWTQLRLHTRVRFNIGFTFRGAAAFDVSLE